jgi:rod shape-determining protein MreC
MPLGTLDRTPPPFFRQGPSALTKLTFCSALALFLMVADTRFKLTEPLRAVVATALHPVERMLLVPLDTWDGVSGYFMGIQQAQSSEAAARRELALQSERAARVEQLRAENERLRSLLALRPGLTVKSQAAEVLYEASDPFSRKVVIDRGAAQGVVPGSPVVNESGVLGQVTRVYPLSSEVTLLIDKDAAIPVLNTRTQARSAAYGGAAAGKRGTLELRFMASNSDVQVGDLLTTSGVDGIYPPGLPVATVVEVDHKTASGFAQIGLAPVAASDAVRYVLVLEPLGLQLPPKPVPEEPAPPSSAPARKPRR